MTLVECPFCHESSDVRGFFDSAMKYFAQIRAMVCRCPICSHEVEMRVDGGEVAVGYSYAAGAWHFAPQTYVRVPDLLKSVDRGRLHIELDDEEWFVPLA